MKKAKRHKVKRRKLDPHFVSLQDWEVEHIMHNKFFFWAPELGRYLHFTEAKEVIRKAKNKVGKSRVLVYKYLRAKYSERQ